MHIYKLMCQLNVSSDTFFQPSETGEHAILFFNISTGMSPMTPIC